LYRTQGRYVEAWNATLSAIRLGGLSDTVTERLARLYLARQSPQRAIGYLTDLLTRRPGRGDLWVQLGEAYLADGKEAQAEEVLTRALDTDIALDQQQIAHERLGMLCLESDPQCALDHFLEVARGPDPTLAREVDRLIAALDGIVSPSGSTRSGEDQALVRAKLGEALYRRGDLALARRQFEKALELAPAYVDGHAYLGHVLSLLGENGLAVQHLERAIALDPAHPLPYYFAGMHYGRQGRWITGRSYLEQGYDLDPSNPAICAAVGETHLRSAEPDYPVAERWLHAAVANAPDDARFHLLLAHFYVDYGVDPAVMGIAVAQTAVNLAPESAEAQETLGWAYFLAGEPDLALEPLIRAQELAPDEPRVHFRLGEVYRALGRIGEAQASYQRAVDGDWHGQIGAQARQAMAP
jgi:tetratricopeptide (TPR) repeat protein